MTAYLLTWNPSRWEWPAAQVRTTMASIGKKGSRPWTWSCGHRKSMPERSRVYLMRQGTKVPEGAFISRCSFSSQAKKVTCDRYKVDRVESDRAIGAKKFYVFKSQFDFQLFKDLSSVENNGRGSVQFGQCKLVAP